jgi:DNA-binding MarR family transcriptional regulator
MISARVARFLSPMWESRYGLSVDTWRILAVINRYGPVSTKEVAARISNDAFHVSRAIDRLVRLDLISRNVDAEDRRRASLEVTKGGRAVCREIEAVLSSVERELLGGMSRSEITRFRQQLAMVDDRMVNLAESGLTWQDFAA